MAQIRLQPPDPFNFRDPEDWPRWKRRFQQFRVASGLVEEDAVKQISTFLYCLGEEAEAVLTSTNATEDDRKDYDLVLAKFDGFFQVRKNVIYERARFNRRNQLSGETAEEYIMVLYNLAENCDYGAMKTEMIRDRLLVGIRDHALSEKMQMDPKLTLETAKKTIRQKEAVQQQQKTLKGVKEPTCLEAVHPGANRQKRPGRRDHQRMSSQRGASKEQKPHSSQAKQCTRCGKGQHPRDKCPAKDATCHKCQRKGHYSALCYSKSVSTLSEESSLETAFLDTMSSKQDKAWFASICIGDQETLFKLDTGAEVTAVSQESWQLLGKPPLSTSDKQLFGPARNPLQVLGQYKGHLSYKGRASTQQVFVVKGLKNNLLGLPAIRALNLVARVDETSSSETTTTFADRIREKSP